MLAEQYNAERARAIEEQGFAASWQRLQGSGVVELATNIVKSLPGVELVLRNEFNGGQPRLAPGITLIGPIEGKSRVELDISAPSSLRALKIAGQITTVTKDINNGSGINNDPFRSFGWEEELPIERRRIKELMWLAVMWAGFVPTDKAKEFAGIFQS